MPFIIERKIDLTILKIEHETNIENIKSRIEELSSRIDIIDIINPTKKIRAAFPDFYFRSLKISYAMKVPNSLEAYLESLSRNRRKRILKSIRDCADEGITLLKEEFLTKENFERFHKIYKKNISEKERGILLLGKEWYAKRKKDACGIFAIRKKKIIGGILLKKKRNAISFCFSSAEKVYESVGINDFINVHALMFAQELGFSHIIRGQDTNMYGHHLSPGLYLYKKSLGFSIQPRKKSGFALTKIQNYNKFGDIIFFVSLNNYHKLEGNLFLKREDYSPEEFKADFLENLHVFYI